MVSKKRPNSPNRTVLPPVPVPFGGKIRNTYKESVPDWAPALPLEPPRRAERDHDRARRRRIRAPRLLWRTDRDAEPRQARRSAGCATTTSTRPPSARRRAGRCSQAATTTRSAWPPSPRPPLAFRATTARFRRARHRRRDAQAERLQHDGARQVAPHPVHRVHRGRPVRPLAARAWASRSSTASSAARPTSGPRCSSRTTTSSTLPTRPGYHLTEDLVDHAIGDIRDQQQANTGRPFFTYLALGACHAPLHAPKEFIEKYKGQVRPGLGQGPRGDARATEAARHHAGGRRADRPRPAGPSRGTT